MASTNEAFPPAEEGTMMSPEELERIWNCQLAACCWSIRLLSPEEQGKFVGIEYAAESQDDSAAQYF